MSVVNENGFMGKILGGQDLKGSEECELGCGDGGWAGQRGDGGFVPEVAGGGLFGTRWLRDDRGSVRVSLTGMVFEKKSRARASAGIQAGMDRNCPAKRLESRQWQSGGLPL